MGLELVFKFRINLFVLNFDYVGGYKLVVVMFVGIENKFGFYLFFFKLLVFILEVVGGGL